jgi:chaperone BCS1
MPIEGFHIGEDIYSTAFLAQAKGLFFRFSRWTASLIFLFSSLSFAIAGVFDLDIYCMSLLEPTLTEGDLSLLFESLPSRCIVLLEDVDSAGLTNRGELVGPKEEELLGIDSYIQPLNKGNRGGTSRSTISLSGLLNAIDGVASPEGRVLIMTTNVSSALDPALVRPGRVDLQIRFNLATHAQIIDLFVRMFQPADRNEKQADSAELHRIARRFAKTLPEGVFSPAEIQGYLLRKKGGFNKAFEGLEAWRDEMLEEKINR